MDMQMPEMDGFEATGASAPMPRLRHVPIVAMTANAMAGTARCLAAGMDDHVAKPIDPDELIGTLLRWVKPQTTAS